MESRNEWVAFTYMLLCSDNTFYVGWTTNICRRLRRHASGRASRYTRGRLPVTMVGFWPCLTKSIAMKLEAEVKKKTKKEKNAFIKQLRTGSGVEFISEVAIQTGAHIVSLPNPARHCDVLNIGRESLPSLKGHKQGFFTNRGRFVDRKEALKIAVRAGQVQLPKKHNPQDQLTSEDVW